MNSVKVPSIPPLLVNGEVILNKFFASQCFAVVNQSLPPPFKLRKDRAFEKTAINGDDITRIIKSLNPKKFHYCGKISIRMIKICGKSFPYPLNLIFDASFEEGVYPELWKKTNIISVHKKESKTLIKNYGSFSHYQYLEKS